LPKKLQIKAAITIKSYAKLFHSKMMLVNVGDIDISKNANYNLGFPQI